MKKNCLLPVLLVFVVTASLSGAQTIYEVAASGSVGELKAALGSGSVDVNKPDSRGWTALFSAAELAMDPAKIGILVRAGARVDVQDSSGRTALSVAAGANEVPEICAELIKAGADVNHVSKDGETPLMEAAARNGNPAVAALLLASGSRRQQTQRRRGDRPGARGHDERQHCDGGCAAAIRCRGERAAEGRKDPVDVRRAVRKEPGHAQEASPSRSGSASSV
jgi:ankyrin repeat protein